MSNIISLLFSLSNMVLNVISILVPMDLDLDLDLGLASIIYKCFSCMKGVADQTMNTNYTR